MTDENFDQKMKNLSVHSQDKSETEELTNSLANENNEAREYFSFSDVNNNNIRKQHFDYDKENAYFKERYENLYIGYRNQPTSAITTSQFNETDVEEESEEDHMYNLQEQIKDLDDLYTKNLEGKIDKSRIKEIYQNLEERAKTLEQILKNQIKKPTNNIETIGTNNENVCEQSGILGLLYDKIEFITIEYQCLKQGYDIPTNLNDEIQNFISDLTNEVNIRAKGIQDACSVTENNFSY